MKRAKRACGAVLASMITLSAAHEASAAAPKKKTLWEKVRAGNDLLESVPTALVYDTAWSFAVHIGTELTNRTWDAPYPWGTLAQWTTRLSYGLAWTAMVSLESLAVISAAGGGVEWIDAAMYRTEWMVAASAPACPRPGAYGGCGVGVGDFAHLRVRPRGMRWWFELGGGWIQQRIANDQFGTVAESSGVLTPITAMYELATPRSAPASLELLAGGGAFIGVHNGHLHPTLRGEREKGLSPPWHGMYLLDAGVGPGGKVELRATFFRHLALEADLVMAPLVVGGPTGSRPSTDIAPLDFEREGVSVWRKTTAGIAWDDPKNMPMKITAAAFAAELSDRPIGLAGHRGAMLRFDFPLRVPAL